MAAGAVESRALGLIGCPCRQALDLQGLECHTYPAVRKHGGGVASVVTVKSRAGATPGSSACLSYRVFSFLSATRAEQLNAICTRESHRESLSGVRLSQVRVK